MSKSRRSLRASPSASSRSARTPSLVVASLVIVLAGAIAYANSLTGPFIFDDFRSIVDNATIREVSWDTLLRPQRQTPVAGRPLANLSFALNYAVAGRSVDVYHLWNITVHILAALALFGVLRRTSMWPEADKRTTDYLALFCALAWLLHPLNTEAVDYITQRTESMAGLFFLLTLYAAIRAWDDKTGWRWPVVAVLACWCGVACKELVITAPAIVVLWDRTFVSSSFRTAFRQRGRLYLGLATSWSLFVLLSLGTPFFNTSGFETTTSRWTYLMNQAPLIVHYLRLSIWPVGLILDYGFPKPMTIAAIWPGALGVMGLLAVTIRALARWPVMGFWGAWFFVTLAPTSSLLPIPSEVGAERRMYLPLVAVIVVLTSVCRWLARSLPAAQVRRLGMASGFAVLLGLALGTILRNSEYRSGLAIWESVVARYPHARAHENLAVQLRDAGRSDDAIEHLRIAAPDLPDARHALGSALIERGDVTGGIDELRIFVRANPLDREIVSARDELASALLRSGDRDGAIEELRAIVHVAPQNTRARTTLVGLLLERERFVEAAAEARAFVGSEPRNATAHNLLGVALASQGALDAAIEEFRAAVQIDPQAKEPRNNLARALQESRH